MYIYTVLIDDNLLDYTVEPLNKGHFGDNINSADVSFVERLSSLRRFKMYYNYREINFVTLTCVLCREVYYTVCPYLGGSTIGGSTVYDCTHQVL